MVLRCIFQFEKNPCIFQRGTEQLIEFKLSPNSLKAIIKFSSLFSIIGMSQVLEMTCSCHCKKKTQSNMNPNKTQTPTCFFLSCCCQPVCTDKIHASLSIFKVLPLFSYKKLSHLTYSQITYH